MKFKKNNVKIEITETKDDKICIDIGAVQKEMGSPNYFKFTREFKSAKI